MMVGHLGIIIFWVDDIIISIVATSSQSSYSSIFPVRQKNIKIVPLNYVLRSLETSKKLGLKYNPFGNICQTTVECHRIYNNWKGNSRPIKVVSNSRNSSNSNFS